MRYKQCTNPDHGECRHIKNSHSIFEHVKCPWCGGLVDTTNIGKWCSTCYIIFTIKNDRVHFGKGLPKTVAVALAMAMQKTGGAKFGDLSRK